MLLLSFVQLLVVVEFVVGVCGEVGGIAQQLALELLLSGSPIGFNCHELLCGFNVGVLARDECLGIRVQSLHILQFKFSGN